LLQPALAENEIPKMPALARMTDTARTIEDRARSYLDANCAHCHRPGGTVASFDTRYDTSLPQQKLIGAPVLIDEGVDGARAIAPHDPWRSIMFMRLNSLDAIKMPPLAHQALDEQGVTLVREWITSLPGPAVLDPPSISPRGGRFASAATVVESSPPLMKTTHLRFGSLSFTATLVSSSFTASNSVVNGINKKPGQRTNGEGPVTGQEVQITVRFNPPISLPADNYFFRPEVLLDSGDFLWLSAPKPIVAPGTPFAADRQSWIRNDDLAPDWLRIGTDITGQGPFNAAFSLSGETDADGDGVADSLDQCPGTPTGEIVDAEGCSIDQLAPCSGPASGGRWKNHGQYVSTVARVTEVFLAQGLITVEQAEEIVAQAAQSNCGALRRATLRRK